MPEFENIGRDSFLTGMGYAIDLGALQTSERLEEILDRSAEEPFRAYWNSVGGYFHSALEKMPNERKKKTY